MIWHTSLKDSWQSIKIESLFTTSRTLGRAYRIIILFNTSRTLGRAYKIIIEKSITAPFAKAANIMLVIGLIKSTHNTQLVKIYFNMYCSLAVKDLIKYDYL